MSVVYAAAATSRRSLLFVFGALLAMLPILLAVATPMVLGRRDELGLTVSWVATPIASVLLAAALSTRPKGRAVVGSIASLLLPAMVGAVTYFMWLVGAEDWMLQKRGVVAFVTIASAAFELVVGLALTFALVAYSPRTLETAQ